MVRGRGVEVVVFPAGLSIRLGMAAPEGFMPVGEGGVEVGVEEAIIRFSYVEEPLGHGMPDTLEVGA